LFEIVGRREKSNALNASKPNVSKRFRKTTIPSAQDERPLGNSQPSREDPMMARQLLIGTDLPAAVSEIEWH